MLKIRAIKGAAIGVGANVAANWLTFGSIQPWNVVIGMFIGASLGIILK